MTRLQKVLQEGSNLDIAVKLESAVHYFGTAAKIMFERKPIRIGIRDLLPLVTTDGLSWSMSGFDLVSKRGTWFL